MNVKLTCLHCDRSFVGSGKFPLGRVRANLTNHIKAAHPDKYRPSKWVKERLARKESDLRSKESVARNSMRPQSERVTITRPLPEPFKRPYTRKPQSALSVCFCPKCGCNIRAVQVAMGI